MSVLQGTDAWFEQRRGKITASRVGGILGMNPYSTRDDVMRDMVRDSLGAEREFNGNVATEWGNDHEDDALTALEADTGSLIVSTGLSTHSIHEWLAASPDGLVGVDHVVEVKAPYSKKIKMLNEQPHYWAQVQIQMACTGRRQAFFGVWTPSAFDYEHVEFNQTWLDEKLPELKGFHDEFLSIIADEELAKPYLEDLVQDMDDDKDWCFWAVKRTKAMIEMQRIKSSVDEAGDELKKLANGRKSRGANVLVYPVKGKVKTDYKTLIGDNCPDVVLKKYQKTGKPTWAVK